MTTIIGLILSYKYYILVPLTAIEGPLVMMVSGFLVKLGYLNFIFAFILIVAGDLFGDIVWYGVGYLFGMSFVRKFGRFFSITEQSVIKVENIFHKHHSTILLLSKLTMGFGFALVTLVTAGLVKTSFRWFVFWNTLGGLIWTGVLMTVGFSLGNFYLKVDNILGKVSVLALFVVIFILLMSILKYASGKFLTKTPYDINHNSNPK